MNETPLDREDHISQIPALQLLQNMGYTYLTPQEALNLRGGRESEVLLVGVVEDWLRKNNGITYKGEQYAFSEGNIQAAVQALRPVLMEGPIVVNEKIYDLLCLGKSLEQSIIGDLKSFTLHYIDWAHPENNVYHVTEEFSVERTASHDTRRPDIVLFVNGIPLAVIECKRPALPGKENEDPLEQAISQHIRNQKEDEIPKLFIYSQILMAVSKNAAKYATAGTSIKFWSMWKEDTNVDADLGPLVNGPLSTEQNDRLFALRDVSVRTFFDELENEGPREITAQDRAIFGLCRHDRLLELTYRFIVYDAGEKKIARYQQYFCVRKIMERLLALDKDGRRPGGVVWHTQGSGKSLTMVMLAKALALEPSIPNFKIILVTDRVDLDDQIYRTFTHCGKEVVQATTGNNLLELLEGNKDRIIATVIDKFEAALKKKDFRDENPNIFVLVDESHRTQYGPRHALMRKALPQGCYIGFTGTPLMKSEKNTMVKFGGLIDSYTIRQAVTDKAVVPLLYEGRDVEMSVDAKAIDSWFDKVTENLVREQQADLKRKYSTANQLNKAEQRVKRIAFDVSLHFRENWQGTPFKGQLVAPDKATALKYKQFLAEFGIVRSEVLISAPDDREGETDVFEENKEAVVRFWKSMMDKHGSPKGYQDNLINAFKYGDDLEIIIVVSKLLTGFDAPRNTVLYLAKTMQGHDLLQAIARVNRLYDGKDFGYILDYVGVLSELNKALDLYGKLSDFEQEDLALTISDISDETRKLSQKYSDLWEVFRGVKNKKDEESYELHLADPALRIKFYERLSDFGRCLQIALSSMRFMTDTPPEKVAKYKSDLKFFMNLRTAVRRRYAEAVDFKEYESRIQKLVDTHVGAGEVEKITNLVNIFDVDAFKTEVDRVESAASKADMIAHRTKKTISEKWDEDPAFYRKFSRILEDAIASFHAQRITDAEYLQRVTAAMSSVRDRTGDEMPPALHGREVAKAFFGVVQEVIERLPISDIDAPTVSADMAVQIDDIIVSSRIVNWGMNADVQNQMRIKIEDRLFEIKERFQLPLTFEDMDVIIEQCLDIARVRYKS